jgi:hypothetical protein
MRREVYTWFKDFYSEMVVTVILLKESHIQNSEIKIQLKNRWHSDRWEASTEAGIFSWIFSKVCKNFCKI